MGAVGTLLRSLPWASMCIPSCCECWLLNAAASLSENHLYPWGEREVPCIRGYHQPTANEWLIIGVQKANLFAPRNQLCGPIPALEFPTGSCSGWSPAEALSCLCFYPPYPMLPPLFPFSWGTPSISHLHKNPCLRLCFQRTWSKTHAHFMLIRGPLLSPEQYISEKTKGEKRNSLTGP